MVSCRWLPSPYMQERGADFNHWMAVYDAAIHNLDHVIAPIVDLASDDVLVIVCSDHGDWMGEYGHWFGHRWTPAGRYNDTDRDAAIEFLKPVFCVMSARSGELEKCRTVSHMDITATVLDWLDRRLPHSVEGESLLPHGFGG